ncbi:MAG: FAD-dependent monooxygenase [Actinomycetota bacterium]
MTIDVPFLIVGGGPVGLLGGILLGEQGRDALVVERRDGPLRAPAAHVVNARTFEICRQAGIDMQAVFALADDPADAGHVNFVSRLGGHLVGRLPFERQGDECLAFTPTPLRNLSQHRFEPLLAAELRTRDGVELRYGHRWESSCADDDGVTSIVTDLDTGERIEIRSRYVIACDGAGSGVRRSLGIEMEGPPRIQSFVMVHFRADLREALGENGGVLHFLLDPEVRGTFVSHGDDEWVLMVAFDPDVETVDDYDDRRCEQLIRDAVVPEVGPIDVVHRGTWHMSAQVAAEMGSGRIFLAGDAAHRFPPTGGLGLNTGAADVHALVWRLGAVEDGWATPRLLDTYAAERLPVAHQNTQASLENAMQIVLLGPALGLDEDPTAAQLERALADDARRPQIEEAVEAQATHFDMLGLQLGYRYGGDRPEANPVRQYEPSAEPGARLPHAWIGAAGLSTLDLVEVDVMTLISVGDHDGWSEVVRSCGTPIAHHAISDPAGVDPRWRETCGVGPGGALLVRPDQHVAWRADALDPAGLVDALAGLLDPAGV